MSGVAGADRIKSRNDFKQFLATYEKVVSRFPGFVSMTTSGSYNSDPAKNDFGDIDLIVHIQSEKDKPTVKKELQAFLQSQPDTVIVPFTSEKHAGKRSYNAGELVSVRYHDDQLGYSAQIDNIVALDQTEATFKQQFLDLPAEKQGLILGLVKIATIETDPQKLFKSLGITAPVLTEPNEEYEFNLSSVEIQLRKVTYKPGTYEQLGREVIWTSRNFDDLKKILYQYNLDATFDELLAQSKQVIKNPRSNARMQGVFSSMITVKSGEVGTAKGAGKEAALGKIQQTFRESRLLREMIKPQTTTVVFAFGRFQPPTIGHELLINTVKNTAAGKSADYVIYVSKTQDHKANPLSINQKMHYLDLMFPGTNFAAANAEVRTFIEAAKLLNKRYKNLIMVAGSDRVEVFQNTLNQYNSKEYNYDTIDVVSAGDRDPDSDSIAGMSGTRMREAAVTGDIKLFMSGLPKSISADDAEQLMKDIQQGLVKQPKTTMKVKEIIPMAEGNEMSDATQARELIGHAMRNPQERDKYFNFIKFLIRKNGKDYGVKVHQLATKLAKEGQDGMAGVGMGNYVVDKSTTNEHIVKHGSGYRLVSKKTGKNLGDFPTRAAAEKHEREVQYFKHAGESVESDDQYTVKYQDQEYPCHDKDHALNKARKLLNFGEKEVYILKNGTPVYRWEIGQEIEPTEESAAWQKKSGKNKNGGLNKKGVASYRREHPGSKLQTAVTKKPSELKPGSKDAKRRKSFCARMGGSKGPMKKPNGEPTRKALALRKWHCESIEDMALMIENAERFLAEAKVEEKWSQKYKKSINCSHPKGFSQKAHCAGKKKHNESLGMEMTCPDCGMCETHGNMSETKQRLDPKCWKGYKKQGTKMKGNTRVNNCVPVGESAEATMSKLIKLLESK